MLQRRWKWNKEKDRVGERKKEREVKGNEKARIME